MKYIGLICDNELEFKELTNKIPGVLSRSYSKHTVWHVVTRECLYKIVNKPTPKFSQCIKYPGQIVHYVPPVKKIKEAITSYPDEIWKDYKGYKVSTYGRVINKWGKLSSQFIENDRWHVRIDKTNEPVHIIMAKVFLKKNRPNERRVDHIDGEILNNCIDNLKWHEPYPKSRYRKSGQPKWFKARQYEKLWIRLLDRRDNPPVKRKPKNRYKKVAATKRHCLHCGKEFWSKGRKQYCKSSHSPANYNAKSLRKRLNDGASKRIPKWEDRLLLVKFIKNKPPGTQVDHIIPLNHPDVCGLHCRDNLQYLSPEENRLKSNKFDGTMGNEGWKKLL